MLGEWVKVLFVSAVRERKGWRIPEGISMHVQEQGTRKEKRKLARNVIKVKQLIVRKGKLEIEGLLPPSKGSFPSILTPSSTFQLN